MGYLLSLVLVAVGVAALMEGQSDDSPGLGGIGMLVIIGAVVLAVRTARRRTARRPTARRPTG